MSNGLYSVKWHRSLYVIDKAAEQNTDLFKWLESWTTFPNCNFVAMVTLHFGSTAKAIEDKLNCPFTTCWLFFPYVLISDSRFMRSCELQLKCYFPILRCRFRSSLTCMFSTICFINLLPWLQRIYADYWVPVPPSKPDANWPVGDCINQWAQAKLLITLVTSLDFFF